MQDRKQFRSVTGPDPEESFVSNDRFTEEDDFSYDSDDDGESCVSSDDSLSYDRFSAETPYDFPSNARFTEEDEFSLDLQDDGEDSESAFSSVDVLPSDRFTDEDDFCYGLGPATLEGMYPCIA